MTDSLVIRRLGTDDAALAREVFCVMAVVFETTPQPLGDRYLARLLGNHDFWALAALRDGTPIGGITAHALPMTRSEDTELFIYDLAVHPDHQRQGVGRALVQALRAEAATRGIRVAFVPADVEDGHALEFYRALGGVEAPVSIFTFE